MTDHAVAPDIGTVSIVIERIAALSPAKRALLEYKLQPGAPSVTREPGIPIRSDRTPAPASFAQQRLWFLQQLEPDSPAYNIPLKFRLLGPLDRTALRGTLGRIITRHEALRTTFTLLDGQLVQITGDSHSVELAVGDLRDHSSAHRESRVEMLAAQEARRPFDLASGPLMRGSLWILGDQDHVLLITLHHSIFDGWSEGIFLREFAELYNGLTSGSAPDLPMPPIRYTDYAEWQQHGLGGPQGCTGDTECARILAGPPSTNTPLTEQLAFWRDYLAGAPAILQLPSDHPRPPRQSYRGAHESIRIGRCLGGKLRELGRAHEATLFMTLLAAFQAVLLRLTNQHDLVIGTAVAGRSRVETENVIGCFINTLALRTNMESDPSFIELLARVRRSTLSAFANQDTPFEKLIDELRPDRDMSASPVIQVMFILQNSPTPVITLNGLEVTIQQVDTQTAKLDLILNLSEDEDGIGGWIEYNADLFEPATIARLRGHLLSAIQGIVEAPARPLSTIPLLTEAERNLILSEWNAVPPPGERPRCIHELFEEQAARTPDATALEMDGRSLTYRELNTRANQIAHALKEFGATPDAPIGICMERSLELVAGLLGILKAGGAYLPLDASYPPERLAFMMADAGTQILLTQKHLLSRLPGHSARVVVVSSDLREFSRYSAANPIAKTPPGSLAYIIYTSGSTGVPKGVMISHDAIAGHCVERMNAYELTPNDRVLQFAVLNFDASLEQLLPPLIRGATVVLAGNDLWSSKELYNKTKDGGLTVMNLPTAYWRRVIQDWPSHSNCTSLATLRLMIVGGDAILPGDLTHWSRLGLDRVSLLNAYGPTETTITATTFQFEAAGTVDSAVQHASRAPIGRPRGGRTTYILNKYGNPVPIGVAGELYIGGAGLARGYLGRPDLTAKQFIPDPFCNVPGARLYRSGDLARYLADGNIEFLGRVDNQVKIRGFRIELREIETALSRHPSVREAIVIPVEDQFGEKRLAAYVTGKSPLAPPAAGPLRAYLQQNLPDYMVPAVFTMLAEMPKTASGKVDRRALPEPDFARSGLEMDFIAPGDAIEEKLAEIWRTVLGVDSVGVTDDFFDLGGHSLLAVRLCAEIEKSFGECLSIGTLFTARTVTRMAALLRADDRREARSVVVPLQPNGSKPPLWCPPAAGGSAFFYDALAAYIGEDQPLYALEPRGMDGRESPDNRIEDMASYFIQEMKSRQPEGPYYLAGLSLGGLIAYEIAQQLKSEGEEVALLVLFDSNAPVLSEALVAPERRTVQVLIRDWIERAQFHLENLSLYRPDERIDYIKARAGILEKRVQSTISGKPCVAHSSRSPVQLSEPVETVMAASDEARYSYEPKPYNGRIVLLRARFQTYPTRNSPCLGWEDLAKGGLEIHHVPGSHRTVIEEPCVRVTSNYLRACLQKAQAEYSV